MASRAQGKPIKSGDSKTVLKVDKFFQKTYPEESVSFWVNKTSEATVTSVRSVYKFRKEEMRGEVVTPRKTTCKVEYQTSRQLKYDGFVVGGMRKIVHSFFTDNRPPTLTKVLEKVNCDPDLPNFMLTTLWRFLKEDGFCSENRAKASLLLERQDLIVWRHSFLRSKRELRRQRKNIMYTDKTWVNLGQAMSKIWKNKTIQNP